MKCCLFAQTASFHRPRQRKWWTISHHLRLWDHMYSRLQILLPDGEEELFLHTCSLMHVCLEEQLDTDYTSMWGECISLQGYNQWNNDVVEQWYGNHSKQSYSYLIQRRSITSFIWTFQRTQEDSTVRPGHTPWASLLGEHRTRQCRGEKGRAGRVEWVEVSGEICDRKSGKSERQEGGETCYDVWFGDSSTVWKTGSWAGGGSAEDAEHIWGTAVMVICIWCHSATQSYLLHCFHQERKYSSDVAKIYSIHITNVIDGVASQCRRCALSSADVGSTCVPCPPGHFMVNGTGECQSCPPNTIIKADQPVGEAACVPCGPNTERNEVMRAVFALHWSSICSIKANIHIYQLYYYGFTQSVQEIAHVYLNVPVSRPTRHVAVSVCWTCRRQEESCCTMISLLCLMPPASKAAPASPTEAWDISITLILLCVGKR